MVGLLAAALLAQTTAPASPPITTPESLAFVRNDGQWDRRALYKGSAPGLDLWVTADGLTLDFYKLEGRQPRVGSQPSKMANRRSGHVVRLSVEGAGAGIPASNEPLPGVANYANGSTHVSGVPRFAEVSLSRVAPGIDARFYYENGKPRYDLVVAPGAEPGEAKLRYDGAKNLRIGAGGKLQYDTALGPVEERDLFVYQDDDGRREPIPAARVVNPDGTVSVKVGSYDESKPLVIDPIVWATYVGGTSNYDYTTDVGVDSVGNPIISGYTLSTDFPKKTGSYAGPVQHSGFVAKFSSDGRSLLWSTMIGTNQTVEGIAVDKNNTVIVTGKATSNWPSVYPPGGTPPTGWSSSGSVGVARIASNGGTIAMARRFGGSDPNEHGSAVAIDINGNILIGGETGSENFPTTAGTIQPVRPPSTNDLAFVAKLTFNGVGVWSTYLGNNGYSYVGGIGEDADGNILVAGGYLGQGMPSLPDNSASTEYGYVVKINPSGTALDYACSFRSNIVDPSESEPPVYINGLAVGSNGEAIVLGGTNYTFDELLFEKTGGSSVSLSGSSLGSGDCFIGKLDADGELVWSKIVGGSEFDYPRDVAVSSLGRVFALMYSNSTDFLVTTGRQPDGSGDAWVCTFEENGDSLRSEVFGGSDYDEAVAAAAIDSSNLYLAGELYSTDLPGTANTFRPAYAGNGDAFLMRVVVGARPPGISGLTITPNIVIGSPNRKVTGYVEFEGPLQEARILNVHRQYSTNLKPITVKVPAGSTSSTFNIYTESVMSQVDGTITVNEVEMGSVSQPITILPPDVTSIVMSASSITGSLQLAGSVYTATPATTGGQQVKFLIRRWPSLELTTELGTIAPCSIPQGGTSQTFFYRSKPVATATDLVIEGPNGVISAPITLLPASIKGLRMVRGDVYGGGIFAYGYVDLTAPAAGSGITVHLNTDLGTLYASTITIPAGYKSAQFRVYTTPTNEVQVGTVTLDEHPATASFTVKPPELVSILCSYRTAKPGAKVPMRVRLTSPTAEGGALVSLSLVEGTGVTLPTSVSIVEGAVYGNFTLLVDPTATPLQTITVKATWKGVEKTYSFTIAVP